MFFFLPVAYAEVDAATLAQMYGDTSATANATDSPTSTAQTGAGENSSSSASIQAGISGAPNTAASSQSSSSGAMPTSTLAFNQPAKKGAGFGFKLKPKLPKNLPKLPKRKKKKDDEIKIIHHVPQVQPKKPATPTIPVAQANTGALHAAAFVLFVCRVTYSGTL